MARASILGPLVRGVLLGEAAGLTDGELLDRYVADRDEAAFEALVRRHGAMVLATCRRVVGRLHDAEDAFQATFFVLACRARHVRPRDAVGSFLHGVARRVAMKSRARLARRSAREAGLRVDDHPLSQPEPDDLRPLLDREIGRLPEKYRAAVVLCELEGRPRKEVARQLGLAEGTLSSRLAAARKMLADRLTRRGVAATAAALGALFESEASAIVPQALTSALLPFARVAGIQAPPGPLAPLVEGAVPMMVSKKLALAAALVVAVTAGVGGSRNAVGEEPAPGAAPAKTAPTPKSVPLANCTACHTPDVHRPAWFVRKLPIDRGEFALEVTRAETFFIPGEVEAPRDKAYVPLFGLRYRVRNTSDRPATFAPGFTLSVPNREDLPAAVFPKFESLVDEKLNWGRLPERAIEPDEQVRGYATFGSKLPQEGEFTVSVTGVSNQAKLEAHGKVFRRVLVLEFKSGEQPQFLRQRWEWREVPSTEPHDRWRDPDVHTHYDTFLKQVLVREVVDPTKAAKLAELDRIMSDLKTKLADLNAQKAKLADRIREVEAAVAKLPLYDPARAVELKSLEPLRQKLKERATEAAQSQSRVEEVEEVIRRLQPATAKPPFDGAESVTVENGRVTIIQSGQTIVIQGGRVVLDAKKGLTVEGGRVELVPKK